MVFARNILKRLHLGERVRVVEVSKANLRKAARSVAENGGIFREHAAFGDQRRDASIRIDLEILGFELIAARKIDQRPGIIRAGFFQGDMRDHRARTRGVVHLQHRNTPSYDDTLHAYAAHLRLVRHMHLAVRCPCDHQGVDDDLCLPMTPLRSCRQSSASALRSCAVRIMMGAVNSCGSVDCRDASRSASLSSINIASKKSPYSRAICSGDTVKPSSRMILAAGPLTADPPIIGDTASTGTRARARRYRRSGTARMGEMLR